MKISADQIETKSLAGHTKDGDPIVYIMSKGGLHAFFKRNGEGQIEAIGAAPHRAIAKFLAEKKAGDIKWKEDFLSKSQPDLAKSEHDLFLKMRKLIFLPPSKDLGGPDDMYFVYDTAKKEIHLVEEEELKNSLAKKELDPYSLVKSANLKERVCLLKDYHAFKKYFEGTE